MDIEIPVSENTSFTEEIVSNESCKALLDNPFFVSVSGDSSGVKLYSYNQMMQMYSIGKSAVEKEKKQKTVVMQAIRHSKPFPSMRMMDIGETLYYGVDKWQAARSAASVLRKQYGCTFKVKKQTDAEGNSQIAVCRLS